MKENKIYQGDVMKILKKMPSQSVDCVVTSPPYWGLRDYGMKGQLGLEKTPEQFVQTMMFVFREVNRILKKDGTLWLNLGDSYAGSGRGRDADGFFNEKSFGKSKQSTNRGAVAGRLVNNKSLSKRAIKAGWIGNAWVKPPPGLKAKDLVGIPWRVAFALQQDGWYLRQDIIWAKPNPTPESVVDRCTKAHEYIFLLSKSGKYYYDADAIREPLTPASILRLGEPNLLNQKGSDRVQGKTNGRMKAVQKKALPETQANLGAHRDEQRKAGAFYDHENDLVWGNRIDHKMNHPLGANKRSVWNVTTKPFSDAHFATFPEELIAPMIKAGCPKGGIVLDPFMGAGTTAVMAKKLMRNYIGIELNPEYVAMAEKRIRQVQTPLL